MGKSALLFFISLWSSLAAGAAQARTSICSLDLHLGVWSCSLSLRAHPNMPVLAYFKASRAPGIFAPYTVIFHLHGIYEDDDNINAYRFDQKMADLGDGFLLLVPRSRGARLDFGPLKNNREVFKNLVLQAEKTLSSATGSAVRLRSKIALTAHSGGYSIAAGMLEHSSSVFNSGIGKNDLQIEALALFDALYSEEEAWIFQRFASKKKKFLSLYRKTERSETWAFNRLLLRYLRPWRITERQMTESNVLALQKEKDGISVFWTDEDHYDLVRNWFLPVLDWLAKLMTPSKTQISAK